MSPAAISRDERFDPALNLMTLRKHIPMPWRGWARPRPASQRPSVSPLSRPSRRLPSPEAAPLPRGSCGGRCADGESRAPVTNGVHGDVMTDSHMVLGTYRDPGESPGEERIRDARTPGTACRGRVIFRQSVYNVVILVPDLLRQVTGIRGCYTWKHLLESSEGSSCEGEITLLAKQPVNRQGRTFRQVRGIPTAVISDFLLQADSRLPNSHLYAQQ